MINRLIAFFSNKPSTDNLQANNQNVPVPIEEKDSNQYPSFTNLSEHQIDAFIDAEVNKRVLNKQTIEIERPDHFLKEAAKLIVLHQQGSTSLIQRKLKLGYNRAGKIIDQLEEIGVVGSFEGSKAREVYITTEEQLEMVFNGRLQSLSPEREYFVREILPSKLAVIEQRVAEIKIAQQHEQTELVKAQIRNEFLIKEEQKREEYQLQELKQQVLKEMIANGEIINLITSNDRMPIPQAVKDMVWNRDGGQCVICGGNQKLEFDHIIPHAKGGAATYRNIQLLCEPCNRSKSDKIGL
ncbi:MAG: hypothetical protein EOO43_00145 [Flavobacterium sp.]|nr:MAG: hypothetical protein EOO43_00145 [Flavobacterium sp.]